MTIAEDLALTLEVCGGAAISRAAARFFVAELETYPEDVVHSALARCRNEVTGRLSLAHVVERIDDGRPGAEEAWAMIPKSEADSAALTDEAREAMFVALPLITIGDLVPARMAFLEAYRRLVSKARATRKRVNWLLTLGHDPTGREAAKADMNARLGYERFPLLDPPRAPMPATDMGEFVESMASLRSMKRALKETDTLEEAEKAHAQGRRCLTGCDKCWNLDTTH